MIGECSPNSVKNNVVWHPFKPYRRGFLTPHGPATRPWKGPCPPMWPTWPHQGGRGGGWEGILVEFWTPEITPLHNFWAIPTPPPRSCQWDGGSAAPTQGRNILFKRTPHFDDTIRIPESNVARNSADCMKAGILKRVAKTNANSPWPGQKQSQVNIRYFKN